MAGYFLPGIIRSLFLQPLREVVFTNECFVCKGARDNDGERVCLQCRNKIPRINNDHPVWKEMEERFLKGGIVSGFVSSFLFEKDGVLQNVLHSLKYEGITTFGIWLGKEIGNRINQTPLLSGADTLIPVPLHPLKKRERGYNQSELLCEGISMVTGIPVGKRVIKRSRYTKSQTQLSAEERKENVAGAFIISSGSQSMVQGKRIIIVDDVMTTGSTIESCGVNLLKNGAKSVYGASVALVK